MEPLESDVVFLILNYPNLYLERIRAIWFLIRKFLTCPCKLGWYLDHGQYFLVQVDK